MERQLDSSPKPTPSDPSAPIVTRREEASARAYEQFEHELAGVNKRLSNPVDDAQHPSVHSEAENPIPDTIETASGKFSGRLPPASTLTPVKFPREKVMFATKPNATGSDMDNSLTRMTMFRPAGQDVGVPDDRPSHGRRYVISLGLLLAACIVAAVTWQSFDGDKAKQLRLVLTSSLGRPGPPVQPSQSTVQADAASAVARQPAAVAQIAAEDDEPTTGALPPKLTQPSPSAVQTDTAAPPKPTAPAQIATENVAPTTATLPPELARLLQTTDAKAPSAQPAPLAQTAPVAPTSAPLPAELTQQLQTITRDLARMEQGIEQLKTSQEQISRDNAKIAEQLKASQEQMARVVAKTSERTLPPKTAARPSRPILTPTR
jgi:hypothetical protein